MAIAQFFQGLWDRVQGKWQVKRICDRVFSEYADGETKLLDLNNLHLAILRIYNCVNKQCLGPHKEPPSRTVIDDKIRAYRAEKTCSINREELYQLACEWMRKDLRVVMANKLMLALLAAPSLAAVTRTAGRRAPRIGPAVDKVPAPVFFSLYAVALLLLQDATMG